MDNQRLLSTMQAARLLGVSRITVFKRIQQGHIRATRVGRNYKICAKDLPTSSRTALTKKERHRLDAVVDRAVKEYGETLRLLGQE